DSWTRPMFDLADEIGMMVYPEIPHVEKDAALGHDVGGGTVFDVYKKQGRLPKEYKHQLADRIHAHWNHPSIWAYSLGNEMYEDKYTPFLCDAYEYVKNELHAPWPISQSGRYFSRREGDAFTKKVDFFDDHYYWLWSESWPQMEWWNSHLGRYIDGRLDRPWFNGECFGMFPNSNYDMFFKTLRTDLPDIPRDKYASLLNRTVADFSGQWRKLYWTKARSNLRLYGIRGFLLETERGDPMRGEYYKRLVETHRRWNQYITGFATHRMRPPRQDEITAFGEMVRQVNNPLYACTDLYFRRHFFAGRDFTTNLYTFNDTLEDVRDVVVPLRIVDENGKTQHEEVIRFPLLKQGEKNEKQIIWHVPASQKTGNYTVELRLRRQGKDVVSNQYNIYILGNDARRTKIKSNQKIALYLPADAKNAGAKHNAIKNVMDRLGVRYEAIRGAQSLSKHDILILGPDSFDATLKSDADAIRRWVNRGGKLLCLEQTEHIGPIPFAREMRLGETFASRVDVIVPRHPVFDGLSADDWDMWDGAGNLLTRKDMGNIFCQRDIQPVSDSVLATSAHHDTFGMAVAEVRVGQGVIFFSQVEATEKYDKDSVATRYLENLLQYTLAESWPEVAIPKYSIPQIKGKPIPSYTVAAIPPSKAVYVNLRDVANRGFRDEKGQDGKGGWFDEGANQDLRLLPVGKRTFAGVPFDIIDPNTNTGRSCVVLHTNQNGRYAKGNRPEQVEIPVGRHVKRLVFLVAGAWIPPPPDRSAIGEIVVKFGGGKCLYAVEVIPLRCNINIGNWWLPGEPLPGAQIGWSARDPRIPNTIGLWMFEWTNRQEESEIEKLIFRTRHRRGIPALVAITGEISTEDPKAETKK
ncbi:MAG: hypothetical protein JXA11_00645, partial [Phycisphaerae bacterium]|nr:hypothetical protein [Phycisphaerae bacterium]